MTRLPVLTYHAVAQSSSPIAVSPTAFVATMQRLARAGWRTLPEQSVLDGLAAGAWSDRAFAVHFDDGFASVRQHAWPVLRDLGFTATIYVVSDWVGRSNDWPGQPAGVPRWPLMTWDDLGALVADGATLGAHTANHPRLPLLSRERQADEIQRSVATILRRTGCSPRTFAYPYGASDSITAGEALRSTEAAFGTRLAHMTAASPRADLPRIDAYYLSDGRSADRLDRLDMRAYLAARRAGRRLRAALGR
jgi:peptidoglycan/xylan/chitin deacetylase (PgdA/CDA1 family)